MPVGLWSRNILWVFFANLLVKESNVPESDQALCMAIVLGSDKPINFHSVYITLAFVYFPDFILKKLQIWQFLPQLFSKLLIGCIIAAREEWRLGLVSWWGNVSWAPFQGPSPSLNWQWSPKISCNSDCQSLSQTCWQDFWRAQKIPICYTQRENVKLLFFWDHPQHFS